MKKSMKAMRLHQPGPVSDEPLQRDEIPLPEPGTGQIRLKVHMCGICHTDLHTVEGELALPRLPVTPGHQIVGVVESKGAEAGRYQVGDRLGVAWLNWACGQCDHCRQGLENLCEAARFTGLHADGGYAQYVVVDERFAYPLPEQFSDAEAAPLLCAGIIGYRSLKLCGIRPGGKLGLYGFGASAHLAIQVARHWGCDVYVFTRSIEHQQHARQLGAVWTGQAQDRPPQSLDAGITFAPAGWIIPLALGHLRPGGTLAINAIHLSPIPTMPYDLIYGERILRSVANFTRQDAQEFLTLAAQIPLKTDVEIYPFDRANTILQRLKASQIRGAAVLQMSG